MKRPGFGTIKAGVTGLLIAVISTLHYTTALSQPYYHALYREFYFIPLMLSGIWFGLRGALIASVSITLIYMPFVVVMWNGFADSDFERILSIVLFNVVASTLGIVSDRQRAMEKELRRMERMKAIGQAVSGFAHDVRTPLTAIGGIVRLVRKGLSEDDPVREKLDIVVSETLRLESMVNDMLDFSRPLVLNPAPVDPGRLLREVIFLVREEASRKNVTIEAVFPEDLPRIILDPERMKEALINVVMNALQSSPEGEVVTISISTKADALLCDIADRGPGITAGNREKVFLPFFTTKTGGTGLGLPIVQKIVEAHGGTVAFLDSEEGAGAICRITLPVLTEPPS